MNDDDTQIDQIKSEASEPVAEEQPETPIEAEETSVDEDVKVSADQSLSEPVTSEASEASLTGKDTDIESTSQDVSAEEPVPAKTFADIPGSRWYVVHTYSGHENKVAAALKQRVESERLEDKILEVLVPVADKIEIKGGKKVTMKEKIFPGYILVRMVLDDASWLAVRTIQGVTSFVGIGNKPTPISDKEVETIVKFTTEETPMFKSVFEVDDTVKIVDGPFAEFIGKIDSVDQEKGKVRVLVSIFGRETPVELDFLQVQKI